VTCNLNIKTMTHTESTLSLKSEALIAKEDQYGAHNIILLPVVLERGEGVHVWDVDGKNIMIFLSAGLNQGHCHKL
jgi:ornithine--oxo-acid transaminase